MESGRGGEGERLAFDQPRAFVSVSPPLLVPHSLCLSLPQFPQDVAQLGEDQLGHGQLYRLGRAGHGENGFASCDAGDGSGEQFFMGPYLDVLPNVLVKMMTTAE